MQVNIGHSISERVFTLLSLDLDSVNGTPQHKNLYYPAIRIHFF